MNVVEINKYPPSLVRHRRYLTQDWISCSDVGKRFHGEVLTVDDYLAVEDRYLRAARRFMGAAGVDQLVVHAFEFWEESPGSNLSAGLQLPEREAPQNGATVSGEALDDIVRRCLRELAWMELVVPRRFLLHVAYDLRLIVATVADTSDAESQTRADGLFTYPGDVDLATLQTWLAPAGPAPAPG